MKKLESKELRIRGLELHDKELIFEWKKSRALMDQLGTVIPASELEHSKWFENKSLDKSSKTFMIDYQSKTIGVIGFNYIDFINRHAEVFIFIGDSTFRGQGIGKKALLEMIDFSFHKMDLRLLYLKVFSYNINAIKLYEKLGFVQTGKIPKYKFLDGSYHDLVIMSLLKREESYN